MPSKFHVVQRQNKDGRLGLPVCQLDTSGAECWHRGWDMKSVNEEGGEGGRGDRVMIGLVQSAYRGGKLPIKRDAIRQAEREDLRRTTLSASPSLITSCDHQLDTFVNQLIMPQS